MKKRIEAALPDRHADLHRRARVDTTLLPWEASPSGTVWRQPLYRVGGEDGPVTRRVRYAPGGAFRPHAHPEGEEILVLDGVFADEHGDYPAGTYLLNPDGSHHAPRSDRGCLPAIPGVLIYKEFFRLIRVTLAKNILKNHSHKNKRAGIAAIVPFS